MSDDSESDVADEVIDTYAWGRGGVSIVHYYMTGRLVFIALLAGEIVFLFGYGLLISPLVFEGVAPVAFGIVGVVLALIALWMNTNLTISKNELEKSVVTVPGIYEMDGHEFAVTIFNAGKPVVIREIDLAVGQAKARPTLGGAVMGKAPFELHYGGLAVVMKMAQLLEPGTVLRLSSEMITDRLQYLMSLKEEAVKEMEVEDHSVYLMVFDNYSEDLAMSRKGGASGLVSACKLGSAKDLFKAVRERKPLPVGRGGFMHMAPAAGGERRFVMQMIKEEPPWKTPMEYVVGRIDNMAKTLEQIRDKLEKPEKKK